MAAEFGDTTTLDAFIEISFAIAGVSNSSETGIDVFVYPLAIILSGVIGAFWITATIIAAKQVSISSQAQTALKSILLKGSQGGFVVLITCGGTILLARWNVTAGTPAIGLAWTCGFAAGVLLAYEIWVAHYSSPAIGQTGAIRKQIRSIVYRTLALEGRRATEERVEAELAAKVKLVDHERIMGEAVDLLHDVIHCARDHNGPYLAKRQEILTQVLDAANSGQAIGQDKLVEELDALKEQHLRPVLVRMVQLFEHLCPNDARPWIALREVAVRQKNGINQKVFKTILRAPELHDARHATSEPIPMDEGLPAHLRLSYQNGNPIIILTNKDKKHACYWRRCQNDRRKEDKNVMAAPIFIKKGLADRELIMIISINSPIDGIFTEKFFPFVKCCADLLSMFFNAARDNSFGSVPIGMDVSRQA